MSSAIRRTATGARSRAFPVATLFSLFTQFASTASAQPSVASDRLVAQAAAADGADDERAEAAADEAARRLDRSSATTRGILSGWEDVVLGEEPPRDLLARCTYPLRPDQDPGLHVQKCQACRRSSLMWPCVDAGLVDGRVTTYAAEIPAGPAREKQILMFADSLGEPTSVSSSSPIGLITWKRSSFTVMLSRPPHQAGRIVITANDRVQDLTVENEDAKRQRLHPCEGRNLAQFVFGLQYGKIEAGQALNCTLPAPYIRVLNATADGWLAVDVGLGSMSAALRTREPLMNGAFVTQRRVRFRGVRKFEMTDGTDAILPTFLLLPR